MRTFTHRSPLQRFLGAGFDDAKADGAGPDVAERMGAWLNVADAITMRTGLATVAAAKPGPAPAGELNLDQELARVRATLTQAIAALGVRAAPKASGRAYLARPVAMTQPPPLEPSTEFTLLLQEYNDIQRRMEMRVDALRSHARQVLSAQSARLAKLSAMDVLMAQMLRAREQNLLAAMPTFLKRRFEVRRQAAATDADASAKEGSEHAWLDALKADFQQALLAELDVRLQPIVGMAQAQREALSCARD